MHFESPGNLMPVTCSIKSAVAASGLSRDVIYNLINEKKVDSCKVGNRRLVFVKSLQDFLHAQKEAVI